MQVLACWPSYFLLLRQKKVSKEKASLPRQVSACRPTHFSLLRQRKVSKRKASQRPCPCGVPCATRAARGRAQTRYAQTSARPDPAAAALLSTAYGSGGPRVLVRCAHLAHASARCCRSRAKPQSIYYDRIVSQSGQTNPPRSDPIQKHLSKPKKPNWVFKLPFTPAGVKGRGGSGGQKAGSARAHKRQHRMRRKAKTPTAPQPKA